MTKENVFRNFITLEGGEGAGKSTVIKELKLKLENKGYEVVITREPGGSFLGEKIRKIIFENELSIQTEALLFASARADHIDNIIIPNLKQGKIVISDRYIDSSIVYQQYVGQCPYVLEFNKYALSECMPSKTFFFDIKPQDALKRIKNNSREENRFDKNTLEFHEDIYKGYHKLLDENKGRIIAIDATVDIDSIVNLILESSDF